MEDVRPLLRSEPRTSGWLMVSVGKQLIEVVVIIGLGDNRLCYSPNIETWQVDSPTGLTGMSMSCDRKCFVAVGVSDSTITRNRRLFLENVQKLIYTC